MKQAKDLQIDSITTKMTEFWPDWEIRWADQQDLADLATNRITRQQLRYRLETKVMQVAHVICALEELP